MALLSDEAYMRRALQLARNGELHASPNPMVGCVIVAPDGRVIGEGWHRRCGTPHAEVNAVESVAEADRLQLCNSVAYVTLEPCSHYGRTPPCAEMLARVKPRRVVAAMTDPNPLVSGRGLEMLRRAGVEVTVGVLEAEARALNRHFITAQTLRRPFVTLKWAQSADGYIDGRDHPGDAPALISSALTKTLVHRERALHDAILVGRGTLEADRPRLATTRYAGPSPRRFVLTSRCERVPEGWEWLSEVSAESLHTMFEAGVTSVLVEGGLQTLQSFIQSGLIDAIRVEVNPHLMLGHKPLRTAAPVLPAEDCAPYFIERVFTG